MESRIEYAHRRHTRHERRRAHAPVSLVAQRAKSAALKVIKLLSFDGDNILKSKHWPYY